ncbi:MAG: FixH family protein [Pseudomonadota bacterium]
MKTFELRGMHVAAIFGIAFSIIISVNLTLATQAVRTFPGLEVKNSYVASQHFDSDRKAQDALGWDVDVQVDGGQMILRIDTAEGPTAPMITRATLGRATHVADDQELAFTHDGAAFVAPIVPLGVGNWNLRLKAVAEDGTVFQRRIPIRVRS